MPFAIDLGFARCIRLLLLVVGNTDPFLTRAPAIITDVCAANLFCFVQLRTLPFHKVSMNLNPVRTSITFNDYATNYGNVLTHARKSPFFPNLYNGDRDPQPAAARRNGRYGVSRKERIWNVRHRQTTAKPAVIQPHPRKRRAYLPSDVSSTLEKSMIVFGLPDDLATKKTLPAANVESVASATLTPLPYT